MLTARRAQPRQRLRERDRAARAERGATCGRVRLAAVLLEEIAHYGFGCAIVLEEEAEAVYVLEADPRPQTAVRVELQHGREAERTMYNAECLERVRATRKLVVGHRAGCSDLFIPVVRHGELQATLLCGPLLTRRPTREMLEAAWRDVASPGAHEGFADFVRGLLTSSAFEGPALGALLRWFKTLATVMAGAGTVRSLERDALDHARAVRQLVPELHMWPTAAGLVDRYENAQWAASYRKNDLTSEGLHEFPTHVIVALPAEQERSSTDIVEHMLCIDALQRTSAALALSLRNTVAGRLGEQGAFILTHLPAASEERTKARLVTLVEKFALFARRKVGLRIACGVSQRALVGTELPERHREALWAAQWGVHRGELATFYRQDKRGPAALPEHGLYAAQRALRAAFAAGDRLATGAAGEGVIQEVLWASGGSIEAIRSHLIALLFELLALIERRGEMEPRVLEETMTHSTRSLLDARTASELTTTFARLVRELQAGPSRRSVLSLRAKLEQARRIIERGYREPMDRASIARTVGISPAHLSREFKATFGMGLREMLVHRRIDGAQRLLRMTTLNVKQVAQETGFSSAAYFVHSFRRATGMTPEQYRRTGMVRR